MDIAFAVVPTLLGFGAAGLIGSQAIKTAKEVMNSISFLKLFEKIEKFKPPPKGPPGGGGGGGGGGGKPPVPPVPPSEKRRKQENQNEGGGEGGGGGGNPPVPPDIKSKEEEEKPKIGISLDKPWWEKIRGRIFGK